jgi:hypothetical protein
MSDEFRLLMISAMYENGGNTTHRFLDGHPNLFVYPFESQLGTRWVDDRLTSLFPAKYRWPVFALDATPEQDYRAIIDEECKIRARTPHVSKFRHQPFDFSDDERQRLYVDAVRARGRSRPHNIEAFFRATRAAWKDCRAPASPTFYVGYSPILVVDAESMLREMPQSHLLHIVRNPWSAYSDTKKRPVPLSLADYLLGWTVNQYFALTVQKKFPTRLHIVRIEDVMADPASTLGSLCDQLGIPRADSLRVPSWNGNPLPEVYPWGTIRKATPEANRATADELTLEEQEEVRLRAGHYLHAFGYERFLEPAPVNR